jgi:hypothetical protein
MSKKLSLPNIGTLSFGAEEAKDDFANNIITPQLGKIIFTKENDKAAEESFSAFAQTTSQVSPQEIDRYFQNLAEKFKNTNHLTLDGLGILTKKDFLLYFEPSFSTAPFFQPIATKRVIHHHTNKDNDATYHQRSYWWIYVLIILIIAGAGCAFYYFYFAK